MNPGSRVSRVQSGPKPRRAAALQRDALQRDAQLFGVRWPGMARQRFGPGAFAELSFEREVSFESGWPKMRVAEEMFVKL
jgi:hypothetical protein